MPAHPGLALLRPIGRGRGFLVAFYRLTGR